MCDNIVRWVKDPNVEGEHNLIPVSCADEVRQLKATIEVLESRIEGLPTA